jgi:hypothetical protein
MAIRRSEARRKAGIKSRFDACAKVSGQCALDVDAAVDDLNPVDLLTSGRGHAGADHKLFGIRSR